jgi:mRNA interferase MazF
MDVRRGDVVLTDFDPTEGSEQRGVRPALVLQNNVGNRNASTTIVAPLTTSYDPQSIRPYESELRADRTVVDQDSVVLLNQIRVVSIRDRVYDNFGHIDPHSPEMAAVEDAIAVSLALR